MSRVRAQRWLDRIWAVSDLKLVPYERPALPSEAPKALQPPAAEPVDAREVKRKARLDALMSIPPTQTTSAGSSGSSSSGSGSSSVSKKRPLKIDVQGKQHTQGVAVVDHLYKLGRAPNPKKEKKEQRVRTAELHLEVGKEGVDHKELCALKKAQDFSVDQWRPMLIAAAVGQWQKAR